MSSATRLIIFFGGIISIYLTRSVYSLFGSNSIGRDAHAHLLFAKDIANNNHRIPERPSKTVTDGVYAYPYLMHWILSFFPERWYDSIDQHFSALMDVFLFCLLYAFISWFDSVDIMSTLVATLLLIATPQLMRPNLSHGIGLSGRKPGLLFTTSSLITFVLWLEIGSAVFIGLSLLSGACILLTSKFGAQAYFFIMVPFSIFVTPIGAGHILATIFIAIFISRGDYLSILKGHLTHLYDYAVSKQFHISYTKPQITLPDFSKINSFYDLLKTGYKNHLVRSLINNPFLFVLLSLFLYKQQHNLQLVLPDGIVVWIGGAVGAFILTSLPYLRFLGQAERYLEYAIVPSAIAIGTGWTVFDMLYKWIVVFFILFGILMIPVFVWAYRTEFSDPEQRECMAEVNNWLNNQSDSVVLVQPIWKGREIAWNTGHKVVDFILNGGTTKESVEEINRLFPNAYGEITSETDWLANKYKPDWVVFDISNDQVYSENILQPPSKDPAFKNQRFAIYDFDDVN